MIFKNFFSFIKENKAVFTVFMLTQICTVIAFLSVFNYAMKFVDEYKQLRTECRTFSVSFSDNTGNSNFQNKTELDASIDKFYQKHKGMISGIEASVNNGDDVIRAKYTYSDEDVFVGRCLSEQDLSSGEKFIIKPNSDFFTRKSKTSESDTYELFGEEYTVIGIGLDDRYTVAYNSLNNVPITGLSITFNRDLNNTEVSLMIKEMKDTFSVDEVKTPQPYSMDMYSQALIYLLAFGIILLIAFMNIVYLYSYVMGKRRKESAVFRICGSNIIEIAKIYFVELVVISLAAYVVGLLVHLFCVMPIMINITSTIGYFITPFEYIAIYLAYFIIELLVFVPIIIKIAKTSPSILNRE